MFAKNARRPEYKRLLADLKEKCGAPTDWRPVPDHGVPSKDVRAFTLVACKKQKALEELQKEARAAGCHLVLTESWMPGEDAALV